MSLVNYYKKIILKSEILNNISEACQYLLHNSDSANQARNYVNSRISLETQKEFKIGYFPDQEHIYELINIVGEDCLKSVSLSNFPSLMQHNLIFPYEDEYDNLVALVGRSLFSDEERKALLISKYKNTSFYKSMYLYGLNKAKKYIQKYDSAILVEGQFDRISCHSKGLGNVVCLGCANIDDIQLYLLSKYTNNIYYLSDNDSAGKKSREKILYNWKNSVLFRYINLKFITLPEIYKDIDQFLKENPIYSMNYPDNKQENISIYDIFTIC